MTRHEAQLHRLLTEVLDDKYLASNIYFKGGTAARMLGFLDRFSVDLDFDLDEKADKKQCRKILYTVFDRLALTIKDESHEALQFFLKYEAPKNERNTIKLEILDKVFKANRYEPQYLAPIERTSVCQTIDTMFANKLVAPLDRYESGERIAGRDIYDIHYFFLQGYDYRKEVIEERRGVPAVEYLAELRNFIDKHITRRVLDEDLNVLLDQDAFKRARKFLKPEVLNFLDQETIR